MANQVRVHILLSFGYLDSFSEDVPLMRLSEMYLIEAEALARSGRDPEAKSILFELQIIEMTKPIESNNTGEDLIEEILLERRKELYGEGLADYTDNRRLGRPIERDEAHIRRYRFNIPGDSPCLLYQIPLSENEFNGKIESNPDCEEEYLKSLVD